MYQAPWQKRLANLAENHGHCEFIGALLAPLIAGVLPEAVAAATVPIIGATVPVVAGDILGGAAIGAATSGLTGGNPLLGALGGGLSGAIGAAGPALGAATGIGEVGGDIATGVAGGLVSSAITGGNPITGALTGGATGALSGILSPSTPSTAASTTAAAAPPAAGAGTTAVPSSGGAAAAGGSAAPLGDLSTNLQTWGVTSGPSNPYYTTGGGGGGGGTVSGISGGGTPGSVSGTSSAPATTSTSGGISGFFNNLLGGGTPNLSGGGTTLTADSSLGAGEFEIGSGGGAVTGTAGPGVSVTGSGEVVAGGGGGLLDTIKGDISKLVSNPLALVSGGILASELFSGGLSNSTDKALQQQADSAASTATMLQAPLRSGILPPGAQSSLDLMQSQGEAGIRSDYATMGMPESTGQSDAFQALAQQVAAQKVGIEENLFAQAGPYAQLASQDDVAILQQQRAEDQQFTQSLMSFVSALAGGRSGTPTPA